jgi:hypothetical protein
VNNEKMTTKFPSVKNQNSDWLARPLNVAYLLKARLNAVAKSTFIGASPLSHGLPFI